MKKKYGMTLEQVQVMIDGQGGTCAICPREPTCIDHDHKTQRVRGVLCSNCNMGLGLLGDNLEGVERAVAYLSDTTL